MRLVRPSSILFGFAAAWFLLRLLYPPLPELLSLPYWATVALDIFSVVAVLLGWRSGSYIGVVMGMLGALPLSLLLNWLVKVL